MKLIYYLLTLIIFICLIPLQPVHSVEKTGDPSATLKPANTNSTSALDRIRIFVLKSYLSSHNSILVDYADEIVAFSNKYQIPWTLVAAISGVESTFCKRIPYNSFNCWGWENGNTRFADYTEAIEIVSKTLGEHYYSRGLDNPYKIGPIYAPPSPSWGWKVNYFIEKIEQYSPPPNQSFLLIG